MKINLIIKLVILVLISFSFCSCIAKRPSSIYLSQKSKPAESLNDFCSRFENQPHFSCSFSSHMPTLYELLVDPFKKNSLKNGSFVEIKTLNEKQFVITLYSIDEKILDQKTIIQEKV